MGKFYKMFFLLCGVYINFNVVELYKNKRLGNFIIIRELDVCVLKKKNLLFLVIDRKVIFIFWKYVVCEERRLEVKN